MGSSSADESSDDESKAKGTEEAVVKTEESPRRTSRRSRQPAQRYKPPVTTPSKRARTRVKQEESDDDDGDGDDYRDYGGFKNKYNAASDGDSDSNIDEKDETASRRPRKKAKEASVKNRTCPHCSKVFTVIMGLEYHVDNFVCRPDQRPGGPKPKGKRKKSSGQQSSTSGSSGKKEYKRVRGKLENRTCPTCKKVFTSTLGMKYHVEKLVCGQVKNSKAGNKRPLETLQPGSQFVTAYGVVEVVEDNRAVSTASGLPANLPDLVRACKTSKAKHDLQSRKQMCSVAIVSRLRRSVLQDAYERNQMSQQVVWEAYFGRDPREIPAYAHKTSVKMPPPPKPDPSTPPDSFPDRMVECVLVPDERPRFLGLNEELAKTNASQGVTGTRLFLQRRLLIEPYIVDVPTYFCEDCGRGFTSKPGCKYHQTSTVCRSKSKRQKEVACEMQAIIEDRWQAARSKPRPKKAPRKQKKQANWTVSVAPEVGPTSGKAKSGLAAVKVIKVKRSEGDAMYPSVLLSLGFKLVAKKPAPRKISAFFTKRTRKVPLKKKVPVVDMTAQDDDELSVTNSFRDERQAAASAETDDDDEDPERVLEALRTELRSEKLQRCKDVAMYPSVLKKLQYVAPRPVAEVVEKPIVAKKASAAKASAAKTTKKRKKTKPLEPPQPVAKAPEPVEEVEEIVAKPTKKKRKMEVKLPAAPSGPPPPIIDVRVLVSEVESGRYPSIKRVADGLDHEDECYICKNEGTLIACDFCTKAVHYECMRTKFTLPYPEPRDDFICNHCIQYIMARRARAEKRRLKKVGITDPTAAATARSEAANRMRRELVDGMEYECVAAQGQEVGDLLKLIRDAQLRLQRNTEMSKMNQIRRSLMQSSEHSATI